MRSSNDIAFSLLRESPDSDSLLQDLCRACQDSLPVDGVGLALMNDDGHQGVVAASDGAARLMEELQFALGEGPCLDASRSRRPVLQPNLGQTASTRWPAFGPAVIEAGIAAIYAFPLQIGAIRLGILDLYRTTPGPLSADELSEALTYADAAVIILLHLQSLRGPERELHPQIGEPVHSRAEIHQATGVVAVQAQVGLAEALLLLRAHAYATSRPILTIAQEVLAGTVGFHTKEDDHE